MDYAREIVDRYWSIRLGVCITDLKPGQVAVATCDRRTYGERGFSCRPLWVMHLGDRAVVSVHPAALAEVSRLGFGRDPEAVLEAEFMAEAQAALATALPGVRLSPSLDDPSGLGVKFYHPGNAPEVAREGEVRLLNAADVDKWAGPSRMGAPAGTLPCAARGEAFGLFLGDLCIAEVMTHDTAVAEMALLIADDGIEVVEAYRGRGYGKALFAAWTREMQRRGRVCLHGTWIGNAGSVGLARAIGYVEYARNWSMHVERE
jgi:ribosomal protein S18 acetylase RimI-like enzyme